MDDVVNFNKVVLGNEIYFKREQMNIDKRIEEYLETKQQAKDKMNSLFHKISYFCNNSIYGHRYNCSFSHVNCSFTVSCDYSIILNAHLNGENLNALDCVTKNSKTTIRIEFVEQEVEKYLAKHFCGLVE